MPLNAAQISLLLDGYAQHKNAQVADICSRYADALNEAIEFIESDTEEPLFNLGALSARNSETAAEQHHERARFHRFLDAVLSPSPDNELLMYFDNNAALAFQNTRPTQVSAALIHAASANLGIEAKFNQGLLSPTHWLTDLDLQQMLRLMGLEQQVKISILNDRAIFSYTLTLVKRDLAQANQPYDIPLLLNCGGTAVQQGHHWICAVIHVDPTQQSIRYDIYDSMSITPAQKETYKTQIEAAIQSSGLLDHADSHLTIDNDHSTIHSQAEQTDGYSCGYRALHQLLQTPSIATNNPLAKEYKALNKPRSEQLVNFVFRALTNGQYSVPASNSSQSPTRRTTRHPVAPRSLKPAPPVPAKPQEPKPATVLLKEIADCIGSYQPNLSLLIFPKTRSVGALDIIQYESLFEGLAEQIGLLNPALAHFKLTQTNSHALEGLNAFYAKNQAYTLFDTLTIQIDLEAHSSKEDFFNALALSLSHLSATHLKQLIIEDPKEILSAKDIGALVDYVNSTSRKPLIGFNITLPNAYQNTKQQRDLDHRTGVNHRTNNQKRLAEQQKAQARLNQPKLIRSRQEEQSLDPRVGLTIDVQMQAQLAVEASPQVTMRLVNPRHAHNDASLRVHRLEDLIQAITSDDFKSFQSVHTFGLTKQQFALYWHQLFGNILIPQRQGNASTRRDFRKAPFQYAADNELCFIYKNTELNGISDAALAHCVAFRAHFQNGINIRELPEGFLLLPDPDHPELRILHYDEQTKVENLLAPKAPAARKEALLSLDLTQQLVRLPTTNALCKALWSALNQSAEYERDKIYLFRRHLLFLMGLSEAQSKILTPLCGEVSHFDFSALERIVQALEQLQQAHSVDIDDFINQDEIRALFAQPQEALNVAHHLNANPSDDHPLFQLLKQQKNNPLISALTSHELSNDKLNQILFIYDKYGHQGLEQLLHAFSAMRALPSIKENTQGYEALLLSEETHQAAQTILTFNSAQRQWWDKLYAAHQPIEDDVITLLKSFIAFSKAIEDQGLSFYDLDGSPEVFKGASNLPTALGRMISILARCKKENKAAQWRVMAHINLSAQGAIRALTDASPYHFVTPEMNIDGMVYSNQGYNTDSIIGLNPNNVLEDFYRHIAQQKHTMPQAFYQKARASLEAARKARSIPAESINLLYNILAKASSGDNCRYAINDAESAYSDWVCIINNIQNINIPGFSDIIKKRLVTFLNQLTYIPSMYVLNHLIKVITTPFQGLSLTQVNEFRNTEEKLLKTFETLNELLCTFHDAIYLGMRFYNDRDFQQEDRSSNLFERHLETCLIIKRKARTPDATDEDFPAYAIWTYQLLALISTFSIKPRDAVAICDEIKNLTTLLENIKREEEHAAQESPPPASETSTSSTQTDDEDSADSTAEETDSETQNPPLEKPKISTNEQRFIKNCPQVIVCFALSYLEEISARDHLTAQTLQEFIKSLERLVKDYNNKYSPSIINDQTEEDIVMISSGIVNYTQLEETQRKSLFSALKPSISAHVETHFAAAFPQGYFERLKEGALEPRVKHLLEEQMKEMSAVAEPILRRFSDTKEAEQIQLINQLSLLCQDLRPVEQEVLLNHLSDPRVLLEASKEQYTLLLEALEQQGADAFIYFMGAVGPREQSDLALKAHYFLSQSLPQIRKKSQPILSEMASIDLVLDLILNAKTNELACELSAESELEKPYKDLILAIQNNSDAFEIHRLINCIPGADTKIPEIEQLKRHIIEKTSAPTPPSPIRNIANWLWSVTGFSQTSPPASDSSVLLLDKDFLTPALAALEQKIKQLRADHHPHKEIIALIEALLTQYPAAKEMLLALTRHYLRLSEPDDIAQALHALAHIKLIAAQLKQIDDEDVVLGLCEHFSKESTEQNPLSYKALLAIFKGESVGDHDFSAYPTLDPKAQIQVLKIITCLLNNDKPCSLADIEYLVNQQTTTHCGTFEILFQCAPYPNIEMIKDWFNTDPSTVLIQYTQWSKNPAPREKINGFHLSMATTQVTKIEGIKHSKLDLEGLNTAILQVKDLETTALLEEIKTFKSADEPDKTRLLALMAELLYRTKGLPDNSTGDKQEWGRSFEINTTQYLALHAMLASGAHVTSQIATGEGKSRIMMIAIACQYALGQTVDFVTSDMSLATRDYLEYQAFFKALGAKTNLIYAQMPAKEYQQGGIHFSDAANLSLFRNKARSEGQGDLVIASNSSKRCLLLDEADKTFFDSSDTRFNYSTQADTAICDMPWIYEYMVEFFETPAHTALYYANADACNQAFISFAKGKGLDDKALARLIPNPKIPRQVITANQLEAWQKAAITALTLELDKDFILKDQVNIQTKTGPKTVSEAQLVIGGRASASSKLSFGVHQCLHARLNRLRHLSQGSSPLERALRALTHPFHVDSESQIVYSSTGKALIDDYAEGELLAVTGTMGSIQERIEAADLYGKSTTPMAFIEVPRHKRSKRADLPVSITTGKAQQQHQILESIRASLKASQPVLLVCENDDESAQLQDFLKAQLTPNEQSSLVRISAQTSMENERKHVDNAAGKKGSITLSTAMLGRGTDIRLHDDAKNEGLNVIATYLPKERDYLQIIGRAGRFGAKGTSRLILDKTRVQKQVGEPLPTDFYTATEAYLASVHRRLDTQIQRHRVVKHHVGGIRLKFTNQFFNTCYKPLIDACPQNKEALLNTWREFFDVTDKLWNETWPHIAVELSQPDCDVAKINALLEQYQADFMSQWDWMRESLKETVGKTTSPSDASIDIEKVLAIDPVPSFALSLQEKVHLQVQNTVDKKTLKTIVAAHYDPAYVGRAVIYNQFADGLKAFFKNLASAYRGQTPWFPNFQAAWNGNMSWRQFFFGGHSHELEAVDMEPNSSKSASYKNMFGVFGTTSVGKESNCETDAPPPQVVSASKAPHDTPNASSDPNSGPPR